MPHVLSKPPLTFQTVHHGPKLAPVTKGTDTGNVTEVLLGFVVVIVIARCVYVWLLDAAGNVLARLP
jgi:hypothetical protein